jgi:hypothetical protein
MSKPGGKPLLTGKRAPRQKKPKDPSEPKRKRGNQGNFSGERLEFLLEAEPQYLAESKKGRGYVSPFINKFMASWWTRFPWYEGLNPLEHTLSQSTLDLSQLVQLEPKKDAGDEEGSGLLLGAAAEIADASAIADASVIAIADASAGPPVDDASKVLHEDDDDDPGWKKTGGVDPALQGAIEVNTTAVSVYLCL